MKRESPAKRRVATLFEEEEDLQSGEIHLPHWNKMCQETRVSDQKTSSSLGKNSDGEAFQNIIKQVVGRTQLEGPLPETLATCLPRSSRREQLTWDIPGKVSDPDQHEVKTWPFCNSIKSRPDRSRVSGLGAEEFGDLIFLDHGSTKNWRPNPLDF